MSSNKRKSIDLKIKLKILRDLENGETVNEVSDKYEIKPSAIYKLRKDKNKFQDYASIQYNIIPNKKRLKSCAFPELETQLYSWFLIQRENCNVVEDEMIKKKAKEIFQSLEAQEGKHFNASAGWLAKFKKRHGIRLLTISGERLSCNESLIPDFIEKFQEIMRENNYLPEQIYNCDETGLVFKSLPKRTNVLRNEKSAPGRKVMKERVTLMPCVNSTGNHKLEMMMIGKSAKPRCFKDLTIPLYYRSSKSAWQTTSLFKEWFQEKFIPEVTEYLRSKNLPVKALLIMDNAASHGTSFILEETDDFKILYLPPNMTAYLQPLDQHIIKSLKTRYRTELMSSLAAKKNVETHKALKEINLKDVAYMIKAAWDDVPKSVIINGFRILFEDIDQIQLNLPSFHFSEDDDLPLLTLFNSVLDDAGNDQEVMDWAHGEQDGIPGDFSDEPFNEDPEFEQDNIECCY